MKPFAEPRTWERILAFAYVWGNSSPVYLGWLLGTFFAFRLIFYTEISDSTSLLWHPVSSLTYIYIKKNRVMKSNKCNQLGNRGTGINTMQTDRWIWICTNEGISFRQDDSWYDLILGTVRYKIIKDRMLNDREHKLGRACTNNDNAKNKIGEHPMVYFPTFLDDEKSLVENHCCITYPQCCCCRCCSFPISFFPHPSFPGKFWGGSSFFWNMKEGTDELSEQTFTTCFEGYGFVSKWLATKFHALSSFSRSDGQSPIFWHTHISKNNHN